MLKKFIKKIIFETLASRFLGLRKRKRSKSKKYGKIGYKLKKIFD